MRKLRGSSVFLSFVPAALVATAAPGAARAGGAADDFTGDGRLDVVATLPEPAGAVRLLALGEDGEIRDLTEAWGLGKIRDAGELVPVDADDDGRLDLLVLPAAGSAAALRLLVRDGSDVFRDTTAKAGLGGVTAATAACLTDLDLDGRLDLVVGTAKAPFVRLWTGKGNGTFREITSASGVSASEPCVGVAAGDTGTDHLPELYLSLRDAPNMLWANLGGGKFRAEPEAAALAAPAASGPTWFFDFDNDNDRDLFVAPAPGDDGPPRLFRNDRGAGLNDVTADVGLEALAGASRFGFGDLDNDGFVELVAARGESVFFLKNDGGSRFVAPGPDSPALGLAPGEALAVADLDYDGDEDVLVSAARADGSIFGPGAYRNPGNNNLWVSVRVAGDPSNRFGVGATVRVLAVDARGIRRDYFRTVGAGSATGASLRQDFGLGRAKRILRLEVKWPATEQQQSFFQPKDECTLIVREGAKSPETVFRGTPESSWH